MLNRPKPDPHGRPLDPDVDAARASWDAGRNVHIFKAIKLGGYLDTELTDAVDRMVAVGWRLHSTALASSVASLETAMFVFVRTQ